jgi:protein-tyrosine phosphatase
MLPPGGPSVVDVTCELPRQHGCRYLCLPTWDTQGPTPDLIEEGVRWALRESADQRPIYIHCAHGHGRSATVMAAAFISAGKAQGIDEAVALMRQARPRVRLNKKQRGVLQQWVDQYHKGEPAQGQGQGAGRAARLPACLPACDVVLRAPPGGGC